MPAASEKPANVKLGPVTWDEIREPMTAALTDALETGRSEDEILAQGLPITLRGITIVVMFRNRAELNRFLSMIPPRPHFA